MLTSTENQTNANNKQPKHQKLQVNYPNNSFTFKNLQTLNPGFAGVTLRVKLMKEVKRGKVKKSEETVNTGRQGPREHLFYVPGGNY